MESTLQKPVFVAAKTTPKATTRSVFRWIHLVFRGARHKNRDCWFFLDPTSVLRVL